MRQEVYSPACHKIHRTVNGKVSMCKMEIFLPPTDEKYSFL